MLNNIEIDGFRSLIGFRLSLYPGLNIIVGTNGTGKSNFITFLDFMGTIFESDLNSAIAVAQGAGSMFSKERFIGVSSTELTFKLDGNIGPLTDSPPSLLSSIEREKKNLSGSYSYECKISYVAAIPAVFISSEKIIIASNNFPNLTVIRSTMRDTDNFKNSIKITPKDHKLNKMIFRYWHGSKEKNDPEKFLEERVAPERSLLTYISNEAAEFTYILNDLTKYRSVNIDPGVARRPSPVGSAITLRSNGEGLAGALYQLKNGTYFPRRFYNRYFLRRGMGVQAFKSILSWCREVNPEIENVRVELDFMEAQLRPYMDFQHGLATDMFAFNRISDGTVKWLALTTVLFAEPGLSIIEEPENFLHPYMQETFVSLCRQALEHDPHRTLIISTHSPTILDCCHPKELTLFQLSDGKTQVARIANREELERKLKDSRFRLGHYYKIGALYGENSSSS